MISTADLELWFSKYNPEKTGFQPVVKPIRIVIEHPVGVWRKLMKIVPYSAPDGGFAVMMPYHKADSGFLYKAQVHDRLANLVLLPRPTVVSRYVVSSTVKMSFHSDGATQFSSMEGKIISGRDSATGFFKGLGIMARPFTKPVWSGETFSIIAWGLSQFETCKPDKDDIRFTIAEMANPHLRYAKKPALGLAAYMISRAKPLASTPTFPDYRAIMKLWNPKLGVFWRREVRLIALHSEEAVIAIHVLKLPNTFSSPSGFRFASPRDKDDFGIYAVYPRESGMKAHQSLDFVPSHAGSATNHTASTIPIQNTLEIPDSPGFLLPEGS